jgi:hypothetical protein
MTIGQVVRYQLLEIYYFKYLNLKFSTWIFHTDLICKYKLNKMQNLLTKIKLWEMLAKKTRKMKSKILQRRFSLLLKL